ncbi:MAG: cob(I)yrinic acid a,c-diamide adenosyltransferase [Prolixibacteraceae bacterium]|nr:cob(I)yrinic acid a,c-diamide adenosyltransferase [Prolixibacteraceae bacterium]
MANKKSKIYTKTGDDGTTGLLGGTRVKKYNLRLEAYGTVDELNAILGVLRSQKIPGDLCDIIIYVQNILFNIGSRLASDEQGDAFTHSLSLTNDHINFLENAIDRMEDELPDLDHFIIPGGDPLSAICHVARTICRRAERRIVEYSEQNMVQPEIIIFINRLSDMLFVMSRKLNAINGIEEKPWEHF